jgi:uncharacterized repeat protein (TIGR03943 family)
MKEFLQRALDQSGQSLRQRSIRLTGFVSRQLPGGGFTLTRLIIFCCAADAIAVNVAVYAAGTGIMQPRVGDWVRVDGSFDGIPDQVNRVPVVRPTTVIRIAEPKNPYDH